MVFVDHLKEQSIETQASYYGRLTPLKLFKVYSPLEALIITVEVQEGRKIRKGQTLAKIKQVLQSKLSNTDLHKKFKEL